MPMANLHTLSLASVLGALLLLGGAVGCGDSSSPSASPVHSMPSLPGTPTSGASANKAPAKGTAPVLYPTPKAAPPVAAQAPVPAPGAPAAKTVAIPPLPGTPGATPAPGTAAPPASSAHKGHPHTLLPGTVRPKNAATLPVYGIDVEVDWQLFTYAGKQTVRYTNTASRALNELVLFTYPNIADLKRGGAPGLVVSNVRVDGVPVRGVQHDGPVIRVPLATPLASGAVTNLALDFKGVIYRLPEQTDDMATKGALEQLLRAIIGDGGHEGGYGVFSITKGIVSLGLWYPIMSSHDGTRWDLARRPRVADDKQIGDVSYFEVGDYDVRITVPRDVTVAATGLEVERKLQGDNQVLRYQAGAVREFTIQASQKYGKASTTVDGVALNSLYLTQHSEVGRKVLDHAAAALKFFNGRFGTYPYRELDIAEAPLVGGAGGVEFPGIVTIATMFYGPNGRVGSNQQLMGGLMSHGLMKETLEFVVAHEVAHEWWNAVVGSDSRRHPFVDEALANHSALLYFEHTHGKAAAERQRMLQVKLGYQTGRMMGGEDHPVDSPTSAFDNMFEYAGIVYGKGALFFDAMRKHARSDEAYFKALSDYYRKFAFAIAEPKDLVDALVSAARDKTAARATARRWLYEKHGDEDIGGFDVASLMSLVPQALRSDPQIGQLMKYFDQDGKLAELLKTLFDDNGRISDDLQIGQLVKTVGGLLADGDPTLERMMAIVGTLIDDPQALLDPRKMPEMITGLAKELVGDDPELKALIDAAGGLLKRMTDDEPPRRRGAPAGTKKKGP